MEQEIEKIMAVLSWQDNSNCILMTEDFLRETLTSVYQKGKEEGMREEAIGCLNHCCQAWNQALIEVKRGLPTKMQAFNTYRDQVLSLLTSLKK